MLEQNGTPTRPVLDAGRPPQQPTSYPLWMWVAVFATGAALLWGIGNWFSQGMMRPPVSTSAFMQVTNRQFSLFLWQFPEYMRTYAPVKKGYLPGFTDQEGKVGILPKYAEEYVEAPVSVLFLYHVWSRLLKSDVILRTFSYNELSDFLTALPEWHPNEWAAAPASYRNLVSKIPQLSTQERTKAVPALPNEVQTAIIGWKNYFYEKTAIEELAPTYQQLVSFLERYPHYARHYWRNILLAQRAQYLEVLTGGKYDANAVVPINEMSGFLKLALYNDQLALSEQSSG